MTEISRDGDVVVADLEDETIAFLRRQLGFLTHVLDDDPNPHPWRHFRVRGVHRRRRCEQLALAVPWVSVSMFVHMEFRDRYQDRIRQRILGACERVLAMIDAGNPVRITEHGLDDWNTALAQIRYRLVGRQARLFTTERTTPAAKAAFTLGGLQQMLIVAARPDLDPSATG